MAKRNYVVQVDSVSPSGYRIENVARTYGPFTAAAARAYAKKIDQHLAKARPGDRYEASVRRISPVPSRLTRHFKHKKAKK